jgi:hypothetical protein
MMLLLLQGCFLHLGIPPAAQWSVAPVQSVVVEPGLEQDFQQALMAALSGRAALGSNASPEVHAQVLIADFTPSLRSEALLYEARLVVLITAAGQSTQFSATRLAPDPGSAGLAQGLRSELFSELSQVVAELAAEWLTSLHPG